MRRLLAWGSAVVVVLMIPGVSLGQEARHAERVAPARTDAVDSAVETGGLAHPGDQHGSKQGHLPPQQHNVKLISRLRLTDTEGGIADVHYYKGYAYLAAWVPECPNGGIHVVDVRNPSNPKKVNFLPAGEHDYVGEGVHTIHIENRAFKGDVLLGNHEPCDAEGEAGMSTWDITKPGETWPLATHFGDIASPDPEGEDVEDGFTHSYHSVLGWTTKNHRNAYAVGVDNDEAGSYDVDIFDISNPARPRLIAETGFPDWPDVTVDANGENVFHHDVWQKKINGRNILGVSYWDAGWVFLDVTDAANPQKLYDTNYPEQDLMGFSPPEGNAHQGVWSKDARFWLGTDEDFAPFRSKFEILTGPNAGVYDGAEFGWTVPIAQNFEGDKAEGNVVYGGSGCPDDPSTPEVEGDTNNNGVADRDEVPEASAYDALYSEGEERILVITRGTCFFSEKVESGQLKGWDMVIVGNHHAGTATGEFPDAYLCGSQGHEFNIQISGGCTGHRAMHNMFNDPPEYSDPVAYNGEDLPPAGTAGEVVKMTSEFDGWGYLNLYNYDTGEFIDYYAAQPTLARNRAFGYGTLSIHEIESDPRAGRNLGYVAWYAVGLKIIKYGPNGLRSAGVYRHAAGNDFWGVSLEKRGKKRPLIYMSDRDSGLWVFKYTGGQ